MAAGTRRQAEIQGLNESDHVSLDMPGDRIEAAIEREDQRKEFEKMADCYPIFCLTANVPKTVSSPENVMPVRDKS